MLFAVLRFFHTISWLNFFPKQCDLLCLKVGTILEHQIGAYTRTLGLIGHFREKLDMGLYSDRAYTRSFTVLYIELSHADV